MIYHWRFSTGFKWARNLYLTDGGLWAIVTPSTEDEPATARFGDINDLKWNNRGSNIMRNVVLVHSNLRRDGLDEEDPKDQGDLSLILYDGSYRLRRYGITTRVIREEIALGNTTSPGPEYPVGAVSRDVFAWQPLGAHNILGFYTRPDYDLINAYTARPVQGPLSGVDPKVNKLLQNAYSASAFGNLIAVEEGCYAIDIVEGTTSAFNQAPNAALGVYVTKDDQVQFNIDLLQGQRYIWAQPVCHLEGAAILLQCTIYGEREFEIQTGVNPEGEPIMGTVTVKELWVHRVSVEEGQVIGSNLIARVYGVPVYYHADGTQTEEKRPDDYWDNPSGVTYKGEGEIYVAAIMWQGELFAMTRPWDSTSQFLEPLAYVNLDDEILLTYRGIGDGGAPIWDWRNTDGQDQRIPDTNGISRAFNVGQSAVRHDMRVPPEVQKLLGL